MLGQLFCDVQANFKTLPNETPKFGGQCTKNELFYLRCTPSQCSIQIHQEIRFSFRKLIGPPEKHQVSDFVVEIESTIAYLYLEESLDSSPAFTNLLAEHYQAALAISFKRFHLDSRG